MLTRAPCVHEQVLEPKRLRIHVVLVAFVVGVVSRRLRRRCRRGRHIGRRARRRRPREQWAASDKEDDFPQVRLRCSKLSEEENIGNHVLA